MSNIWSIEIALCFRILSGCDNNNQSEIKSSLGRRRFTLQSAEIPLGQITGTNFGLFVHQKYGDRSFSLGFSALTGSYRQPGSGVSEMPTAPPNSAEAQALRAKPSDAIFVGPSQLAEMKTVPGAFFRHFYQTLPWFTFLDGVVVFRDEYPPSRASGK